jgi:hypothetical protein
MPPIRSCLQGCLVFHAAGYAHRYGGTSMFIPGGMEIDTACFDVHTGGYGNRYRVLGVSYRGVWKSISRASMFILGGMEMGMTPYR